MIKMGISIVGLRSVCWFFFEKIVILSFYFSFFAQEVDMCETDEGNLTACNNRMCGILFGCERARAFIIVFISKSDRSHVHNIFRFYLDY